jgi:hypothetical protein
MTIEQTIEGYWLATCSFRNRILLAEGATAEEAFLHWIAAARELLGNA